MWNYMSFVDFQTMRCKSTFQKINEVVRHEYFHFRILSGANSFNADNHRKFWIRTKNVQLLVAPSLFSKIRNQMQCHIYCYQLCTFLLFSILLKHNHCGEQNLSNIPLHAPTKWVEATLLFQDVVYYLSLYTMPLN